MAITFAIRRIHGWRPHMPPVAHDELRDGDHCDVIGGTHKGKSGTVRDVHESKTGHLTITVVQADGNRFKTLAKNVRVRGHVAD